MLARSSQKTDHSTRVVKITSRSYLDVVSDRPNLLSSAATKKYRQLVLRTEYGVSPHSSTLSSTLFFEETDVNCGAT